MTYCFCFSCNYFLQKIRLVQLILVPYCLYNFITQVLDKEQILSFTILSVHHMHSRAISVHFAEPNLCIYIHRHKCSSFRP